MEECWANLGGKIAGKWNPADPASYLAVGRDFARLDLYREDAVEILRKGLSVSPNNLELTLELSKMYERMGMPAEALSVKLPLMAPGGPLAPVEPASGASSAAAPPATENGTQ